MRVALSRRGLVGALAIAAILVALPAANAANGSIRVLVGFKNAPSAAERQLVASVGGQVVYEYDLIPAMAVDVSAGAAKQLEKSPAVSYVEQELHRTPLAHIVPGELYTGTPEILPWGVERVNADAVWDTNGNLVIDSISVPAGQGVKVAVLDSGVDMTHPDLAANLDLANSFDFLDNDSNVSDIPGPVTGHGTETSGIVAAVDNSIGVIGTAPRAKVIMYRVCDSSVAPGGACPDSAIVAGLQEAVEDGADVVSMSFGGVGISQAMKQAVKAVGDAGIVQVASAGNEPTPVAGARNYPAGFSEVISVGAIDQNDNLATFSTFGGHQELVAPGVETPTTFLQGEGRDATLEENSPTAGLDFDPNPMAFTGLNPALTANLINAGLGQASDFAGIACAGKIALISRGAITFGSKVDNAMADGCLGAVVYNNAPGNFSGTLGAPKAIPAVSLSQAEGQSLVAQLAGGAVNVTLKVIALDYESFSGTSASAPYVSGVAALVLSAAPSLSSGEVREILDRTAEELGPSQRSIFYGYGLVDALAAVQCAKGQISC
jgi:subtilisin family serine protease